MVSSDDLKSKQELTLEVKLHKSVMKNNKLEEQKEAPTKPKKGRWQACWNLFEKHKVRGISRLEDVEVTFKVRRSSLPSPAEEACYKVFRCTGMAGIRRILRPRK